MAVSHDNGSESHTGATGSASEASFEWTHSINVGTTPRGITVFVVNVSAAAFLATAVTYAGASLSEVTACRAQDTAGEAGAVQVFHLGTSVPTGASGLVHVDRTNNADELWAVAISENAAADTAIHEAGIVLLQGDNTLAEQSVTDGSPGTNSIRYAGGHSGLGAFPSAGANSNNMHNFDTGNQTAAVVVETLAGQGARSVGFSSGTSEDRAFTHFAVKEIAAAATMSLLWNPYPSSLYSR